MTDSKCEFRAYGENAATFLIFQALAAKVDALAKVFVARLKQFETGKTGKWQKLSNPQVWLFPNFGKTWGYGEPDALVLAGKYAFWVEVETTINCKRSLPALRNSLLQLWRFRLFQDALSAEVVTRRGKECIVGRTLSDSREVRVAALRLKDHRVLQAIRERLTTAKSHYVLFTAGKPKGEGKGKLGYCKVLSRELKQLVNGYQGLPILKCDECWYAYWKGDLDKPFNDMPGIKLNLDDCYVRIKRSR